MKYPNLFNEKIISSKQRIQAFMQEYAPIDEMFAQEMVKNIDKITIVRLGANKIYVGQIQKNKCNGKCILIFKNGNVYEGQMVNNKRHGKGAFVQTNVGWYIG